MEAKNRKNKEKKQKNKINNRWVIVSIEEVVTRNKERGLYGEKFY